MRPASAFLMLAFAMPATACSIRAMGPEGLFQSTSSEEPADAGSGDPDLATPGKGIALPPACTVDGAQTKSMTLLPVPAGQFAMGCNATVDTECSADEKPEHMVTLDAFSIDQTEVTQAQYALCVQAGKCSNPYCAWNACTDPNLPVSCVYQQQAIEYCSFVGETLPTEAQWEKAARGVDGRKFPWGSTAITCDLANLSGCSGTDAGAGADGGVDGVLPVGSFPKGASPYGALDMAGNVVEWTLDSYDATYYASSPATNPTGPAANADSSFVGRGGGWASEAVWQRAGARDDYQPLYVKNSMGFRCVGAGQSTTGDQP